MQPQSATFTPKKILSKNNRYYAVVDRRSNITIIKLCYHTDLYLNDEPWLHKRALLPVPSYSCTYRNQSVIYIYILTLCDNLLEDYYIARPSEYPAFVINWLTSTER